MGDNHPMREGSYHPFIVVICSLFLSFRIDCKCVASSSRFISSDPLIIFAILSLLCSFKHVFMSEKIWLDSMIAQKCISNAHCPSEIVSVALVHRSEDVLEIPISDGNKALVFYGFLLNCPFINQSIIDSIHGF